MYRTLSLCICLLALTGTALASDHLLYFEGQEIFGYSSALRQTIAYSRHPDAEMQKPSLGFDYLQRFSGESGDVATIALQARLAVTRVDPLPGYKSDPSLPSYKEDGFKSELQIYNAYLKVKTPWTYVWAGTTALHSGLQQISTATACCCRPLKCGTVTTGTGG